ncbi:MAG: hypothetical protein ACTSO6_12130 [Promethearchaeota archaeon]
MVKTKKSKFIIFTILSVVILLTLSPLIGLMDTFFRLKANKIQTIDGEVNVSVSINVEFDSIYFEMVYYSYFIEFDFTHNASITAVEVGNVNYRIYHNTRIMETYSGLYYPNVVFFRSIEIGFGDNLTCQGSVDLNYQLNSVPQNDTISYDLIYSHSIRKQDANSFAINKAAIFIAYIASFFLVPLILYFKIHPDFHEPSKEEKEEIDKFFDYLKKEKPNESI